MYIVVNKYLPHFFKTSKKKVHGDMTWWKKRVGTEFFKQYGAVYEHLRDKMTNAGKNLTRFSSGSLFRGMSSLL